MIRCLLLGEKLLFGTRGFTKSCRLFCIHSMTHFLFPNCRSRTTSATPSERKTNRIFHLLYLLLSFFLSPCPTPTSIAWAARLGGVLLSTVSLSLNQLHHSCTFVLSPYFLYSATKRAVRKQAGISNTLLFSPS